MSNTNESEYESQKVKIGIPCPCCMAKSLLEIKTAVLNIELAEIFLPKSGDYATKKNQKRIYKFLKIYMKSLDKIQNANFELFQTVKIAGAVQEKLNKKHKESEMEAEAELETENGEL
jgi:hypothetical protein